MPVPADVRTKQGCKKNKGMQTTICLLQIQLAIEHYTFQSQRLEIEKYAIDTSVNIFKLATSSREVLQITAIQNTVRVQETVSALCSCEVRSHPLGSSQTMVLQNINTPPLSLSL